MLEEAKNKLLSGAATVSEFIFSDLDPSLATYFAKKTEELIKSKSFDHVGKGVRYVDIVRDVINLVPVHWISQEIVGLVDPFTSNLFFLIYYVGWTPVKNRG